jgi:hypothetical protein
MVCDFYVEQCLVIEFISLNGNFCKIITNKKREKGFIDKYVPGSDKYEKKLVKKIEKFSYVKMIYEKKTWTKDEYQKKYEERIRKWFPEIKDFIKIYKDSIAWPK